MSQPAPTVSIVKMYASRKEIYARETKGIYATWRWVCVWLTQLMFYGLPWLSWNERQAVLFDLGTRKFYLFGIVLWPQDFIYLALLLIICAYALFLFTAVAGRVWCGFSCPQTVYTEIFMWVERKIEGTRSARMRLDKQPWTLEKVSRKTAKHSAWGAISLWTGFTFIGYFTPIHTLAGEVAAFSLGPWQSFWIFFYAFATYGNAGWLREQVCRYMCPYARFQSAMFDQDTLIVSYDKTRGEPRAPLAKTHSGPADGSCIDCTMCVQVCPTGIDIRDGLQYDCISCAACVDACDDVMDRIGAPRGLVRFTTDNALANNFSAKQIRQRATRPRVLIYSAILVLVVTALFSSLLTRTPLKVDVIRDRGSMAREGENGTIENIFRLHVMNTDEATHRYRIRVTGLDGIALDGNDEITLEGTGVRTLPLTVRLPYKQGRPRTNDIAFEVQALDDERIHVKEKARFFVPASR
ncbi:cytochrome c oxidase accessory protein CcoG [Janthinobacterium fluminis]|uniref:Cytochrome c oxidase accessory protein CcoG n=1 Tax=Janthinobacterium fluminis TaxID=2987524 RepID=A0ABT5JX03_9BURK|nr:cytochrome c oxidase accessory protein CcoG [Janthinobacterium fluminis]MDC8757094.1 cytochrome c oxidase accessory protein CcoG [Janthinobacterium fluminis]